MGERYREREMDVNLAPSYIPFLIESIDNRPVPCSGTARGRERGRTGSRPRNPMGLYTLLPSRGKCRAEAARLRGRASRSNITRDKHRIAPRKKKKKVIRNGRSFGTRFARLFHALALSRVRARGRGERLAQMRQTMHLRNVFRRLRFYSYTRTKGRGGRSRGAKRKVTRTRLNVTPLKLTAGKTRVSRAGHGSSAKMRVCMRPAYEPGRFADPIGLSEGELRTGRCLIDEYLISRRKHASSAMRETRNGFAPDFRKTDLARSLARAVF